jgi:hypothetical protein
LTAAAITGCGGATSYSFSVTYADETALDAASLDGGDVLVTGPNGFSQLARLVSVSGSGGGRVVATYGLTGPGGAWDFAANGTYTVSVVAGQVTDAAGNAVAAGALGTFAVALVPPDYAGNFMETARSFGTIDPGRIRVAEDYVGRGDRNDYYKVRVTTRLRLYFKLTELGENADLRFYDAAGRQLKIAKHGGTNNEALRVDVNPGTYYLRVQFSGSSGTTYRLRVQGIALTAAQAPTAAVPQPAGRAAQPALVPTISSIDLGALAPGKVRATDGAVTTGNRTATYAFHVSDPSRVYAKLSGMGDDADLTILDGSGRPVAASSHEGSGNEAVRRDLEPGLYYARVSLGGGGGGGGASGTNYRLRLAGM